MQSINYFVGVVQARIWRALVYLVNRLNRRLLLFASLVFAISAFGASLMYGILSANGLSFLELLLLLLFVFSFTWISSAFVTGLLGFIIQLIRIDPMTLQPISEYQNENNLANSEQSLGGFSTAIVMPIYNEDVTRVMAGIEVTLRSLIATGQHDRFSFFVLCDSTDSEIQAQEWQAFSFLRVHFAGQFEALYYRRRTDNSHRKVGNISEFCQRFGGHYDAMLVLDADSIMTGNSMVELAQRMHNNPKAGLIQTIPMPVRQATLFGRLIQYAAHMCCPVLATGIAFWQTTNANYWGHNAIIRMRAFTESCGLPSLPGRGPFGGEILSHDFVEAALLKSKGWDVVLATDISGSFEEVPSNIFDFAARDRRWVKGNIQHLALLNMSGATLISKLHFMMGAAAYLSSAIWLITLLLSSFDAISSAVIPNQFFSSAYQLFPHWPIAKTDEIQFLLCLTALLLLFPKLAALIIGLVHKRRDLGHWYQLLGSTLLEVVVAIIVAPIMMVFHSIFVIGALAGIEVSWESQPRHDRVISWQEAWKRTWLMPVAALVIGALTLFFTPLFFIWLMPVIFGLAIAPIMVSVTSSVTVGECFAHFGLLSITLPAPQETLVLGIDKFLKVYHRYLNIDDSAIFNTQPEHLPEEFRLPMPVQCLSRRQRPPAAVQMAKVP